MSKRDNVNAVLGALSLFTDAAASIHANNLQVEENAIERDFKSTQAQLSRDFSSNQAELSRSHELNRVEIEKQNKIELDKINYEREISFQFPGVKFENGNPDLVNYDFTKSTEYQKGNILSINNKLIEFGLDSEGTSEQLSERLRMFNIGINIAKNASGATLNPDVSLTMGGDVSSEFLTSNDVLDIKEYIGNNLVDDGQGNKVLGAVAVQTLKSMNAIPFNMEILVDNNGLQYLNPENTELVNVMITGMENGISKNINYMSNIDYINHENAITDRTINRAAQIAGSPGVINATQAFNNYSANYAGQIGFVMVDNEPAFNWGNNLVGVNEVFELVEAYAEKNPAFRSEQADVEDIIRTSLVGDATAMPVIMEMLRTMGEQRRETALRNLETIEGNEKGMARQIRRAWSTWSKIQNVATKTNAYYSNEPTVGVAKGFKKDLRDYGISKDIVTLRNLELSGNDNSDEYNQIFTRYQSNLEQLMALYGNDEVKIKELRNWIDLEQATYKLNQSIK
tara:strand:+ start:7863 stop:9398 length:1536 start_codon:yes stop_codon:yes gene_type:complete